MQKAAGTTNSAQQTAPALLDGPRQAAPQTVKAILLMCVAWAAFAGIDTSAKYLAQTYQLPTAQIIWSRFIGQFAAIVLVMGLASLPRLLRSTMPGLQLTRSILLLGSTAANFVAMQHLRLDQTTTILFLTPLTVALLAGPILGEWVGWRRMIAILVGFVGVLVAVRPGFGGMHWMAIFSFASMIAYAFFSLLTRYLAPHDPPEVTLFYSLMAGTFILAPVAIAQWMPVPDLTAALLLATIGLWAAIGHYLFIIAHRYAPAATIAPFVYIAILTHSLAGYLVFNDVPDQWTLGGAAIVVSSGLYLLHRERIRAREVAKTETVSGL